MSLKFFLTVALLFCWLSPGCAAAEPVKRVIAFQPEPKSAELFWKSGYAAVKARINGQEVFLGLSPFTEFSVLTEKAFQRLGLEKLQDYSAVTLIKNFEIDGAISANEPFVLESAELGELDGILGHSFLREFTVRADLRGRLLTLLPPGDPPPADPVREVVFSMEIRESEVTFNGSGVTARRGFFVMAARTAQGLVLPFAIHFYTDTNLSIPESILKQKLPHIPMDAQGGAVLPEFTDGNMVIKLGRFLVLREDQPQYSQKFGILAGQEITPLEFVLDYRNGRVRMKAPVSSLEFAGVGMSLKQDGEGWIVEQITENKAAARAGLVKGDRLLFFNGLACAKLSPTELGKAVSTIQNPKLQFSRTGPDGREQKLAFSQLPSDEWPDDPGIRGHLRQARLAEDTGEIVIPAESFAGLLIVGAEVNGMPVRLAVDTGSSGTVVDSKIAARIGLGSLRQLSIRNATGESVSMASGVASSIKVGGLSVTSEPVLMGDVKTEGLPWDGYLGSATLRDFIFELNWREKKFSIRKRGSTSPAEGDIRLKLNLLETATLPHDNPHRWRPVTYTAELEVMGKPFPLLLDSGFSGALDLPGDLLKTTFPDLAANVSPAASVGMGITGEMLVRKKLVLPQFTLGMETVGDLPVTVSAGISGILGAGVLQHFVVTVDVEGEAAWLRPLGSLKDLKSGGTLGLQGGLQDGHIFVQAVEPDGPAEKGGLRAGDMLRFFNGFEVAGKTPDDIGAELKKYSPGDRINVGVSRRGVDMEFQVVMKPK